MILAIDLGNTHTVIGIIEEDGRIAHVCRLETNRKKTSYEYAVSIKQILYLIGVDVLQCDGAVLSCVVPELRQTLHSAIRMVTGQSALVVGAGMKTGLRILIDDPGTIAADLVAAAVAAKNTCPLPCIVIDMGTATTVTVVNKDGAYIGGTIMAGVGISMDVLAERASLLPSFDIVPPKKVIATATMDSMRAGILYGTAGALDGIIDRFQEEIGPARSIVATGGYARMICSCCRHHIRIEEHLLLKGLWHLWRLNQA